MPTDPADDDAARASLRRSARPGAKDDVGQPARDWKPTRRTIVLCVAFLVPCAVIALSVVSIIRDTRREVTAPVAGSAATLGSSGSAGVSTVGVASSLPLIEASPTEFIDETDDGEPSPSKPSARKHYSTVQQAAADSCSTASVEGLSRQIIEQARCMRPNAVVPLPTRPNLVLAANVFPYLEREARDHLLHALDSHVAAKMTINSALRTVAQQYLVSRWAASKRCGVQLATQPGESNHEIGAALDIAEPAQWRSALEAQEFRWLGTSDRVHFDYKSAAPGHQVAPDVLAFQTLWNRNHVDDRLPVDGRYDTATEQRLKKAPPAGFPLGPACGKPDVPAPRSPRARG